MHTWLNANKLTKTEFMQIGSGQRLNTVTASPSVTMDGTRVEQVVTTKPFGVTTDDKLSWNFHFEKLTKKIACGIRAMKRVKYLVPKATLRLVDQALIQPHFGYCCTVWRTCGVTREDKLQNFSIEQLVFWHSQIVTFSNCQRFQLSEILRWKILTASESYKRPPWYSNVYLG